MKTINAFKLGVLSILFLSMVVPHSGCMTDRITTKCGIKTYDKQLSELLNGREDWQEYTYKRINVYYETGLDEHARLLAPLTEELVLFVERELKLQLNISEITFFLLHAKDENPIPEEENIFSGTGFKNQKALINLFIPENANLDMILKKNSHIYPGGLFHELVEGKLATRIKINFKSTKHEAESMLLTRWFREGFSSYAGYIAFQHLLSKINIPAKANKTLLYNGLDRHPFSNLSKIGRDIFKWRQLNTYGHDVNIDHYNAALGLFLLIKDRYGVDAIAEIGKEINDLKRADGKDLIALCNKVTGTDIVKLANSFYFPDFGIEKEPLFPIDNMEVPYGICVKKVSPGSIAQKAGIQEKDIIIKVGQKNISTDFEFECAIFRSLQQQQIPIEIRRKNNNDILSFMLDIK